MAKPSFSKTPDKSKILQTDTTRVGQREDREVGAAARCDFHRPPLENQGLPTQRATSSFRTGRGEDSTLHNSTSAQTAREDVAPTAARLSPGVAAVASSRLRASIATWAEQSSS